MRSRSWGKGPTHRASVRRFYGAGKILLDQAGRAAGGRLSVAAASGPDGMGNTAEGGQPLIVSILVAIIDEWAGEQAIAIVLVRTRRGHAHVRRQKRSAPVRRLREVHVGLEARTCRIVPWVIKRKVHLAGQRINREPVAEAIPGERQLVFHTARRRPGRATIVGKGKKDVGDFARRLIHPTAVGTAAMRTARTSATAR